MSGPDGDWRTTDHWRPDVAPGIAYLPVLAVLDQVFDHSRIGQRRRIAERVDLFDRWSETYDRSVLDESGVHDGYDRVLEAVVRAAAKAGARKRGALAGGMTSSYHFDWQTGRVTNRTAGSDWSMEIHPGTQDKFSQQLRLMLAVSKGAQMIEFPVADGGLLKGYRFEQQGWEQVTTRIGAFNSLKLSRSKNDKPSRASYWLAPKLNHLPVKVVRTEPDGNFVMLLRSLTWH